MSSVKERTYGSASHSLALLPKVTGEAITQPKLCREATTREVKGEREPKGDKPYQLRACFMKTCSTEISCTSHKKKSR